MTVRAVGSRLTIQIVARRPAVLARLMTRFAFRKLLDSEGRLAAYRALGAQIGEDVHFGPRTAVRLPANLSVGDGCRISGAIIEGWGPVTIGRNVMINDDVALFTTQHDVDSPIFVSDVQSIQIGDWVWLAHHVRLLPGVNVGNYAVVGTGAVAASDIPPYGVAVGNPATVIRERARIEYTYRPNEPPV